jgi:hypothetical protein
MEVKGAGDALSSESGDRREKVSRQTRYQLDRQLRKALTRVMDALAPMVIHGGALLFTLICSLPASVIFSGTNPQGIPRALQVSPT